MKTIEKLERKSKTIANLQAENKALQKRIEELEFEVVRAESSRDFWQGKCEQVAKWNVRLRTTVERLKNKILNLV
jgi:peptidoglycan hydrolase CwlO-like protein